MSELLTRRHEHERRCVPANSRVRRGFRRTRLFVGTSFSQELGRVVLIQVKFGNLKSVITIMILEGIVNRHSPLIAYDGL